MIEVVEVEQVRKLADKIKKPVTKYGVSLKASEKLRRTVDGHTFASLAERLRYDDLKYLEMAGQIDDLKIQQEYKFVINGVQICRYFADFTYFENGNHIVEDVKGVRTEGYNLKKKLMQALFGISIRETEAHGYNRGYPTKGWGDDKLSLHDKKRRSYPRRRRK